jgi:hypothetical protein
MMLVNIITLLGGALGLVGIGYNICTLRELKDYMKAQGSRLDAQGSRTDALGSRTDALYAALLEERKLQAKASKKADERSFEESQRYFGLLEEVKDIKRKDVIAMDE